MSEREINEDDLLLAAALAGGAKVPAIAEKLGVSTRTIHRRKADPAFRALVSEIRSTMLDGVVGRLAELADEAVTALAGLLKPESDGVRLQAANVVLSTLLKAREHVELSDRLAALEQRAGKSRSALPPSPSLRMTGD
jgi:predicted trehalose synthase